MAERTTWAEMIKQEIILLKARMELIEGKLVAMASALPTGAGTEEAKSLKEIGAVYEDIREFGPKNIYEMLSLVAGARRALYGYAMLLDQMGLSKDQKKMVKELENAISMVLRLTQTVRLLMVATEAMEAASPWAIPFLMLAGGTFAASVAYGSRLSGSGI